MDATQRARLIVVFFVETRDAAPKRCGRRPVFVFFF
jgi:hypothetical protein